MGLTAVKSVRLEAAGFDQFFNDKKTLWRGLAERTYQFVKQTLAETDAGEPVRPDDLIAPLVPALEASPAMREFLASKKLTQKFWNEWFAEWVIESLWDELSKEE